MTRARYSLAGAVAVMGIAATVACSDVSSTGPNAPNLSHGTPSSTVQLLECPADSTITASGNISPLVETTIRASDGSFITIPALAVDMQRTLVLTVPAGNYVTVDLKVDSLESFQFKKPVTIGISYSRCSRNNIKKDTLGAVYLNPSGTFDVMPNSSDSRANKVVTFPTGHLSGYAIAQ